MSISTTFSITDDTKPTGTVLEGVTVRAFSEDGETFVTQGTTDEDGELILELEDSTTYWVRFFKATYEFPTRRTVDVDSAETNEFDIEGTNLMEHPPSSNEFLCRASGYVRGIDWSPQAGIRMTFMGVVKPRVLADQVIIGGDLITESDADGWIEVELVQGGSYDVIVEGMGDVVQRVQVPEKQAVSISHLIWPYIQMLAYASSTASVAEGETTTVAVTVTLSSGVETPFEMDEGDLFRASSFITFTIADEAVCAISWDTDDNMVIEGIQAGSTTITAEAKEEAEVEHLPTPTRSLATLTITVTE